MRMHKLLTFTSPFFTLISSALALTPSSSTASRPSPALMPLDVVQSQLSALQAGDVRRCFEFASPTNKKATGPWQRFEMSAQHPALHVHGRHVCSTLPSRRSGSPDSRLFATCRVHFLRGRVWPFIGSKPLAVPSARPPSRFDLGAFCCRCTCRVLRLEPLTAE